MKKFFLFPIILFSVILFSGCSYGGLVTDQLTGSGSYQYQNKDLGFTINLPTEFQYYQTQRKETTEFVDIEFFVPTSDISYLQEVPGYAKSIVVRVFGSDAWNSIKEDEGEKAVYQELGKKDQRVYTIRFWQQVPVDWQDRWSEEMKQRIVESFKIK